MWLPDIAGIDMGVDDPAFWDRKLDDIVDTFRMVGNPKLKPEMGRAALTGYALWMYPTARDYMISTGYTREEVEAMHPARVVVNHVIGLYQIQRDDMFKWFCLPYHQGWEEVAECERRRQGSKDPSQTSVLAQLLLPALGAARFNAARHHRTMELARLIEAIRMYAAENDGRLPGSLDEITSVPVPNDPVTGRPFGFSREGDAVVIESIPPQPQHAARHRLRVEVRLAE
jgi:hypothetical protein